MAIKFVILTAIAAAYLLGHLVAFEALSLTISLLRREPKIEEKRPVRRKHRGKR